MVRQAGLVLVLRTAGAILIFLANMIVANIIGVEAYGTSSFLLAAASIAAMFAVFGSNRVLTRNVSSSFASEKITSTRYAVQALVQTGFGMALAGPLFIVLLLYANESLLNISLFLALALLFSLKQLGEGFLLGCSKSVFVAANESIVRPVGILAVLLVLARFSEADMHSYLLSVCLAILLVVLLEWLRVWPFISLSERAPMVSTREWWRQSLPFFLLTMSAVVQGQAGVFLLGLFESDAETGLYAVAIRISMLISFAFTAANMVYMGSYARAYKSGDVDSLNQDVKMFSILTAAFVCIVFPCLLLTATFWLGLFGEGFEAGRNILIIHTTTLSLSTFFGPAALLLSMTDYSVEASKVVVVSTIANILLTVQFILMWGGEGAATANLITVVITNAFLGYLVWKRLGVRSGVVGMMLYRES